MQFRPAFRLAFFVALAASCLATDANADIVTFTTGRSILVESALVDGDVVVLRMRDGTRARTPMSVVAEIVPGDATPNLTAALDALASSRAAVSARLDASALRAIVDRVARRLGFDTRLAHAIVEIESSYNPLAVSSKGAMGLMQITAAVARTYSASDPYEPEQNLEAGLRHLARLIQRFDIRHALAAYNAGEGAVRRYGGIPPFPETQSYVRRVMAAMR